MPLTPDTLDDALRVIYKYPLRPGLQPVSVPYGALPLHADAQGRDIVIWFLVDPNAPAHDVTVLCLATGEVVTDDALANLNHLSTVLIHSLVFHVFVGTQW